MNDLPGVVRVVLKGSEQHPANGGVGAGHRVAEPGVVEIEERVVERSVSSLELFDGADPVRIGQSPLVAQLQRDFDAMCDRKAIEVDRPRIEALMA